VYHVQAFQIPSGNSSIIYCENCTYLDGMYAATNISFDCLESECATADPINSTCSIIADLEGGEAIMNFEEPCGLNITCDSNRCGKFQEFEYLNKLEITKSSSEFKIDIEIFDHKEESVQNWSTSINQDDVVEQKSEFKYICPHEVITDVNMQTCATYLDDIMGETNPMIFALATGQNECTKMLRDCETDKKAEQMAYLDWKDKFEIEQRARINCVEDLEDAKFNLYNVSGSCYQNKKEIEDMYARYRMTTVGNGWFYGFVVLFIINLIYGAWYLFGKGDFG
jgi:hypothetical protein